MTVSDRFKKILIEQLQVDESEVTPDARLIEDLGCDELDIIELVMAAEEEFDLEISDEDAGIPSSESRPDKGGLWRTGEAQTGLEALKLRSFGDWIGYLTRKTNEQKPFGEPAHS